MTETAWQEEEQVDGKELTTLAQGGTGLEVAQMGLNPYQGISSKPVSQEAAAILMGPVDPMDVEIRPDGIIYYPEIKYRRVLNTAFGPLGWGLVPRSEVARNDDTLSQEWALFVDGRFASQARGECDYIPSNKGMSYASVVEGVKSNALMRCAKDLGIASELWDPSFITEWQREYAVRVWRRESKDRKPQWRRKDRDPFSDETGIVQDIKPQVDQSESRQSPRPTMPNDIPGFDKALQADMAVHAANHAEQSKPVRSEALDHFRQELKEFMTSPLAKEMGLDETDIPDLIQQVTRYDAYEKDGRTIPAFAGVRSFDDPLMSDKRAQAALGKFRQRLKALQEQHAAKAKAKKAKPSK